MSDGRHGKDETSIIAGLKARLERVTADRDRLARDLAERERLDQVTFAAADLPAAAGDQTGPIARVQGPRAAAHRIPREARWLRVVPGFILAAPIALRWAWRVHRAATVAAGVTAFTLATTAAVVVPGAASAREHPPAAASIPGWHTTATPIAVPSPSMAALTRPKSSLDAKSADSSPPAVTVLPWYDYPPTSAAPASAQPSASPSSPAAPAAGILTADTADGTQQIDLGPAAGTLTTAINLSASGGDVTWGAIPHLGRDARAAEDTVTLDSDQGQVSDGGSGAISVTIGLTAQDNGGTVTVKVWGGSGQAVTITISWEPAPAPTPSPADVAPTAGATDMPSPAAS